VTSLWAQPRPPGGGGGPRSSGPTSARPTRVRTRLRRRWGWPQARGAAGGGATGGPPGRPDPGHPARPELEDSTLGSADVVSYPELMKQGDNPANNTKLLLQALPTGVAPAL